jgi:ketosteroid isomerase-like protein
VTAPLLLSLLDTAQMMSQEDVKIVRDALKRFVFEEEGVASAKDRYSPDIVWEVRTDLPDAEVYEGHEGLIRLHARFAEVMDDVWIEPLEYIPVGDNTVVVPLRWGGRGKGSGMEFEESHETWVYVLRDGKIAWVREYATREQALEAAGLSE